VLAVAVLGNLLATILEGGINALVVGVTSVHTGSASVANVVLDVVAGTAGKVVTTPFVAAFMTVLYFDLRVRKEALDLQLLAQRIGVEPPPEVLRAALAASEPPPASGSEPPFWPPPPGWKPGDGAR